MIRNKVFVLYGANYLGKKRALEGIKNGFLQPAIPVSMILYSTLRKLKLLSYMSFYQASRFQPQHYASLKTSNVCQNKHEQYFMHD